MLRRSKWKLHLHLLPWLHRPRVALHRWLKLRHRRRRRRPRRPLSLGRARAASGRPSSMKVEDEDERQVPGGGGAFRLHQPEVLLHHHRGEAVPVAENPEECKQAQPERR